MQAERLAPIRIAASSLSANVDDGLDLIVAS